MSSLKRSTGAPSQSQKSFGRSGAGGGAAATVDPLDPSQLDVSVIGWNHFEQKFQELRGLLSAPASGLNAHEARAQQKHNVSSAIVQLLDRAQQDCRRLLVEGNAKAAVEGGLKTLRLKEAYYGHGHLQLVPAYFHLARTNQYMDKFKAAEEFLSLAQWTILRNKDVDVSLKAELHQTFGLLYASDAKLDAALKQLTSATYYLCVMNGPEHILTSFGYFDLGNVFAAKSNMEHAMAFYDRVKDIWYQHLTTALRMALEPNGDEMTEGHIAGAEMLVAANFGIENLQDAVKMLRGIVGLQTERYGRVHPSTARAEFVLGMFMLWNGDAPSAMGSLLKALEISKRVYGERHPNTGEIRSLMLNFHLDVPEDTSYVLEDGYEGEAQPKQQQASSEEEAPRQPTPTTNGQQRIPTPPTETKQHDSPRRSLQDEVTPVADANQAAQEPSGDAQEPTAEGDAVSEPTPEADAAQETAAEEVSASESAPAQDAAHEAAPQDDEVQEPAQEAAPQDDEVQEPAQEAAPQDDEVQETADAPEPSPKDDGAPEPGLQVVADLEPTPSAGDDAERLVTDDVQPTVVADGAVEEAPAETDAPQEPVAQAEDATE
jgi:hypothetical protein